MKSILAAAALLGGLAFTTVAQATPIMYQFSATQGWELRDRFLHLRRDNRSGVRYIHHDSRIWAWSRRSLHTGGSDHTAFDNANRDLRCGHYRRDLRRT